jgi:ABC-type glycerol-3-phosphate transport system substrate-binding protein
MARSRLQATPLHRDLTLPGKRNLPGEVACCLKPELHLRAGPISRFPCVFKCLSTQRYVAAKVEYYVQNLTFPWDIGPVPKGTKGLDRISYAGTNTLHIYSGTKTPDQSWDLLKYISGPGGMKYFLATGTPALISAAQSKEYMTGQPEHRQAAVDVGAYGRTYYPDLGNDKWKQVYDQEIQALWLGKGNAEQVCPEICTKIQPILDSL